MEKILRLLRFESMEMGKTAVTKWLTFQKFLFGGLSILLLGVIGLQLIGDSTDLLSEKATSLFGLFMMMFFGYLLSNNRKAINLRLVLMGLLLQFSFAWITMKTAIGYRFFDIASSVVTGLLAFTNKGSSFLFGDKLMDSQNFGFIFAFQVLPTVIFVSAFTAVLYYFGILQVIVGFMAKIMSKLMRISGAESLSSAVNVFVGQTEAPLFVRPYVPTMTNSELMTVMTGGFATIAGAVMAAYAVFLQQAGLGEGAGHLLVASVISAPAAIVMAKIIFPETGTTQTGIGETIKVPITDANMLDAATRGASEGLRLAVNVGAMLLVFIAFIALFNWMVGPGLDWISTFFGFESLGLSLEKLFGWIFAPLAWIMGVPWEDCNKVGNLLGQKTVINEFVAYLNLAPMIKNGDISLKSQIISIYALCGFSNFSSIAIQIGGIGTMAPTRRADLCRLGLKAMIAGSLACFMTATVAGILL